MAVGEEVTLTSARLTFAMSDGTTDQVTIDYPVNGLLSSDTTVLEGVLFGSDAGYPVQNIAVGYANTGGATIDAVSKVEQITTITRLNSDAVMALSDHATV